MRLRTLIATALVAGCKITPSVQADGREAGPAPAASASDVARCDATVAHWVEIVVAERKVPVPEQHRAESVAQCKRETWTAALLDCMDRAKTASELERVCYKLPFADGRVDVTPKRTFAATDPALSRAQPPMFMEDGDTATFESEGKKCGLIAVQRGPGAAAFIVCNGQVLAGPLTSPDEMKQAVAIVVRSVAPRNGGGGGAVPSGYDPARAVRAAWPSGGGTYQVYNSATGQPLYKTF